MVYDIFYAFRWIIRAKHSGMSIDNTYVPSMTMDLKIYGQYGGSRIRLLWLPASFCTNGVENQYLPMFEFSSIRDPF